MHIAPGGHDIKKFVIRERIPYMVYSGSIAKLSDDEIVDDEHEFKNLVKWLIITTNDQDQIKIVEETFIPEIGHNNIIIFGRSRERQDNRIFGDNVVDVLFNTPFGLFGKNEDELLDMLDSGGSFEVLESNHQHMKTGIPGGKKAFLRVQSDGHLAVPGTLKALTKGESLILVTSG